MTAPEHNRAVRSTAHENLGDWLRRATELLERAGIASPKLEAQILAAHGLGQDRTWVLAHPEHVGTAPLDALLERRLSHEPLAYIVGWREFYGRRFAVRPGVLIPRQETEVLVEAALDRIPSDSTQRVLDIGVGSGAIAITIALERPIARVVGVDVSPEALAVAASNASALGAMVEIIEADLFPPGTAKFDLIVSNPPYVARGDAIGEGVAFEPELALYGGDDGLAVFRRLAAEAPARLAPEGWLLVEIGAGQEHEVESIFTGTGWETQDARRDLDGHLRVLGFRRPA